MVKSAITGKWRFAVYILVAIIYFLICYFTPRDHTGRLITLYVILFAYYLAVLKWADSEQIIRENIWLAVGIRVFILFSIPNLSDDFYRFIWDGNLSNYGINPFASTPEAINLAQNGNYQITGLNPHLYSLLNSKQYFSVYPPVCQGIFSFTAWISAGNLYGNILLLKIVILCFEIGTILLLIPLLRQFNIQYRNILLYALNPLIIIELCGNIHFEAAMIFFLTASFYFILKGKDWLAAILFGLAISSKLLPLIFMPFLFKYIGFKRTFIFSIIAGAVTLITFIPFIDASLIQNLTTSINLYFNEFEYNASLYYLGKWLGGWNDADVKQSLQILMPLLSLMSIVGLSIYYKRENFFSACMIAATIYFICSTTVHPWYITIFVLFAAITGYRYAIYWTGLIILTYFTYRTNAYLENFYLIAIEYILVISILLYELFWKNKPSAKTVDS